MHQPVLHPVTEYLIRISSARHSRISETHTTVPYLHLHKVIRLLRVIEIETVTGRADSRTRLAFDTSLGLLVVKRRICGIQHRLTNVHTAAILGVLLLQLLL